MIVTKFPIDFDVTNALSVYASGLDAAALPVKTRSNLKMFFLDYIAAVHAGYRAGKEQGNVLRAVVCDGNPSGKAHIFFSRDSSSPLCAVFINAFLAHSADMDDGNRFAAGHIGAHVVSSLMALAEDRRSDYSDFYSAMAVGYEVFCRLSAACMPHMIDRGFHSTGTAGALASAAACARLLRLDSNGIANAISLSATQASGLLLAGETRQDMKALNPANAARVGVFSALLAEKGVEGPLRPLESTKGWLHAMSPSVDVDILLDNLGKKSCIDESYLKPYPSCRHTHGVIEAAISLSREVSCVDISGIDVVTYGHAIDLAGRIDVPSTVGEAKFSIKYAVATALSKGRFALEDLTPGSIEEVILTLISKTRLLQDDGYERPADGVRGARLVIRTKNGKVFSREVLAPKGEPENPFSFQDVKDKLSSCFSDADGHPNAEGATEFLEWYIPIMSDWNRSFVFPQRGAGR